MLPLDIVSGSGSVGMLAGVMALPVRTFAQRVLLALGG
jgi:hypothetical protein